MKRGGEFAKNHRVRLLQGAQELFPALIEAMDAALSDIQFETYIFDFTGAGAQVAEALIRAAQRGVRNIWWWMAWAPGRCQRRGSSA